MEDSNHLQKVIDNKGIIIKEIFDDVFLELIEATQKYGKFNSAHEGYAVLLEECDELWKEIKRPEETKSIYSMKKEAIQVAAMAIRFIMDICNEK